MRDNGWVQPNVHSKPICVASWAGALALALTIHTLQAATFYVSTTGSDSAPGSLAQPFRSINRAVSAVAPGDTVLVRGGLYAESVNLWAQGSSSARVIFRSYPGELAILDGATLAANTTLVTISGDYVDWSGFEVRNSTRTGVTIWEANHVQILNNSIHHCWLGGVFVGGSAFGLTANNRIEGNQIYQNCQVNAPHTAASGWPAAIGSQWTEDLSVIGNVVFQNHGEGVAFTLANNGLADGNEVRDNYSVGIYLDNARFTTVRGNYVWSTGDTAFFRSGHPANGISLANEFYSGSNPLSDNLILNNILVGGKRALYYGAYDAGGGLRNTLIAHNTCYNATQAMLGIEADSGHSGTVIANNIFQQTVAGASLVAVVNNGISFHHNTWSGGSPGLAAGAGDVLASPLLVNPGGALDTDYQLLPTSPCIQAAADLTQATDDYFGTARTSPADIGAFEYSVGAPTGPAAPSSLAASALNSSQVHLTWIDNASNEDGFHLERSTDGVNFAALTTLPADSVSYADLTPLPSTTYHYRVRSFNAGGNSAWAPTAVVTTPAAPPLAPSALTATALAKRKIRLNWIDNSANESGFRVERSTDGIAWSQVASLAANTITWTQSSLTAGVTYRYRVRSYNAAGNSAYSNIATATARN